MHIVQLLPELNQGGVERGTVELNRELVKLGHQSTVVSAGGKLASVIQDDGGDHITLNLCSKNPFTFFQRSYLLKQVLKKINPDILHARSRIPAWLCWRANNSFNIPVITTVHGFNRVNPYSRIMTQGDLVIYSSLSVKKYILENYGVESHKLRYVPRGIDTEYFNTEQIDQQWITEFKDFHNLHNRQIITTVGRITEWKGHDDFIRAISLAQKSNPRIIALIVGGVWHRKKDYLNELKKLAISCGAEVIFAGSHTHIREIYELSDLVISPASTKPETFGRVAAEALSMNTPVIASNHGGSCDIIINKVNGILYSPKNIQELSHNILSYEHTSFRNMREHIYKNFSLQVMLKLEIDVYTEALKYKE